MEKIPYYYIGKFDIEEELFKQRPDKDGALAGITKEKNIDGDIYKYEKSYVFVDGKWEPVNHPVFGYCDEKVKVIDEP